MKVKFRKVEAMADDLEAMQRRIAQRAAQVFRERGGVIGRALDDWLTAERETTWRPALEVRRKPEGFEVTAAVAGVEPASLDVRVSQNELLVTADLHHRHGEQEGDVLLCEFADGPLFRAYRFPEPIDPAKVSTDYRNGLLRVTAPLAQPARRVAVTVT